MYYFVNKRKAFVRVEDELDAAMLVLDEGYEQIDRYYFVKSHKRLLDLEAQHQLRLKYNVRYDADETFGYDYMGDCDLLPHSEEQAYLRELDGTGMHHFYAPFLKTLADVLNGKSQVVSETIYYIICTHTGGVAQTEYPSHLNMLNNYTITTERFYIDDDGLIRDRSTVLPYEVGKYICTNGSAHHSSLMGLTVEKANEFASHIANIPVGMRW